jgi:hypothetical protein
MGDSSVLQAVTVCLVHLCTAMSATEADSDSVCLGSNPSSPATLPFAIVRIEPQPSNKSLKAEANPSVDARL